MAEVPCGTERSEHCWFCKFVGFVFLIDCFFMRVALIGTRHRQSRLDLRLSLMLRGVKCQGLIYLLRSIVLLRYYEMNI